MINPFSWLVWAVALAAAQPPTPEMGPRDAIFAAADAAPVPISALFVMPVKASGRDDGRVYLNSELDYRDQRCLTVRIEPEAVAWFEQSFGMPPEEYFVGKSIRVRGMARRERIDFLGSNGRPSGLYYYQTHVRVSDPAQIETVEASH